MGRPATPDYVRFARMVDENRATAEVYVVGNIVARSRVDTEAGKFWLRHSVPEWRDDEPTVPVSTIDARQMDVVVIPAAQMDAIVHGLLDQRRAAYKDPPIIEELDEAPRGLSELARAGLREDG